MEKTAEEKLKEVTKELEGTKKMLDMLLENIPGGVMEYDVETEKIGYVSKGLTNIFGCSEKSFREHFLNSFGLFVYKFDRPMVKEQIANQTAFFDTVELTYRVRGIMDDIIWVTHKGKLYTDSNGVRRFLVVINDVTNEKLIQSELQRSSEQLYMETERLKLIEEAVDNTEYDYNVINDCMETSEKDEKGNRRLIRRFMENDCLSAVIHPDDLPFCMELFQDCLKSPKKGTVEYRIREKGNNAYSWARLTFISFADKNDRVIRVVGSAKDITEEKKKSEELKAKIALDGMTGLLNKTTMEERVEEFIKNSSFGSIHAMMMIDTDNFKNVNDTLGHAYGDKVIKFVSSTIKEIFRESDYVGRMGGDEFMVFMKNTTRSITEARAVKLNNSIRRAFTEKGITVGISCSIGIAYFARDGVDYQSLFKAADRALYDAKEAGKDCFRIYKKDGTL